MKSQAKSQPIGMPQLLAKFTYNIKKAGFKMSNAVNEKNKIAENVNNNFAIGHSLTRKLVSPVKSTP